MPWKVQPVPQIRFAFVQAVLQLKITIAEAARRFGISRKTAHKWIHIYRANPDKPLADRSRRPRHSPERTAAQAEQRLLDARDRFRWGPRKLRAYLLRSDPHLSLPSVRTCANILARHGRIHPQTPAPQPLLRFERATPNELWQCDFKGPLEVARRRVAPFSILDDHSRFLLALRAAPDQTYASAWAILWETFGLYGLPDAMLCDNAFKGTTAVGLPSLSWFEACLLRLNIRCLHGRPYHPQTQGKIERLHGTLERELWPRVDRHSLQGFNADCEHWRAHIYNAIRPHESLADQPPLSQYRPSRRKRPAVLPELEYPAGAVLRKIHSTGAVSWKSCRILIGRGLAGDCVRIEERERELVVFYGPHEVRRISVDQLRTDTFL